MLLLSFVLFFSFFLYSLKSLFGTRIKLYVCMIYCDAGPCCHLNCLQAAGSCLSQISYYLSWYVFLLRRRSFASRKAIHFSRNTLLFLAAELSDRA